MIQPARILGQGEGEGGVVERGGGGGGGGIGGVRNLCIAGLFSLKDTVRKLNKKLHV